MSASHRLPAFPPFRTLRPGARIGMAAALLSAAFLSGCAPSSRPAAAPGATVEGRSCREPEEMLEILSRFATLVQAGRYHEAIAMLDPADQKRMLAADGTVPEETKRKLDALDFKALSRDRRVDLVRGRLTGIYDCLPCLDQGPADTVTRAEPSAPAAAADEGRKRAHLALEFYRRVQEGRFDAAGDLVHPGEWKVFLDEKGEVGDLSRRRLQAMLECDLEALTLREGKLVGVVLLLEPPVSDLYLASMRFFDAVEQDRIGDALGMLLESEKKFFLGPDGRPRPDRVARLKALERSEWRRLYLYHDVLLGVAEAAIGYANL